MRRRGWPGLIEKVSPPFAVCVQRLNALVLEDIFTTQDKLKVVVSQHYTRQCGER